MAQRHKFQRIRGTVYTVLARCLKCGLEREGTNGNYTYLTRTRDIYSGLTKTKHSDVEPECVRRYVRSIQHAPTNSEGDE